MTAGVPSVRTRRGLALLAGLAWVAFHYWIFRAFFPNHHGALGFDYGYFLPHLLDGEYWRIVNGPFAIQWFTPAFCGGIPKFANPQSLSFSAPQLFTYLSDPLTGVKITLIAFGAIGYVGFYRFQRRLFGISRPIATLGAALFLFNTCFSSRMLIGHLTFHTFMLVPWLPLWLLAKGGASWRERALEIAGAAGVLAYLASQAIAHVLFQALLFTAIAALLQAALVPQRVVARRSALRAAAVAPLALALCAAKLSAMAAFLAQFPRTQYPLAGVGAVPELLWLVFRSLFLEPSQDLNSVVVNWPWRLTQPEFEFGVSLIPLGLLALAFVMRGVANRPIVPRDSLRGARRASFAGAIGLLTIPLALNYYHPAWHAFLKSLPVFGNSTVLFRWLSVYVPVAILAGTFAIDRAVSPPALRAWVLAGGAALLAWHQLARDRTFYELQNFDPTPVIEAFASARQHGFAPSIHAIAVRDRSDTALSRRNSVIAHGESQLECYETLFGFRLERLPRNYLHVGPVFELRNGMFNLNDPSCFLFPRENACAPGWPFLRAREGAAQAFASYRPFPFAMPLRQRIADAVNAAALIAVGAGLALHLLDRGLRRAIGRFR